jgi:hypothetical protein
MDVCVHDTGTPTYNLSLIMKGTEQGHNMKLHLIIIQLVITIFLIFVFPIYSFANLEGLAADINEHTPEAITGSVHAKR